ncbi:MAG: MBL fold metallo-hydrolase [Propionibacteriaceae bacterium]|nr:MBL fold metallo-hydrolase [Propionibacteriaceae bacterium]
MTATSIGDWRELAPGVHMVTCEPESVNAGLVVGTDAAMLVDAGSTPEQGAALLASAREISDVPVTHVVITHNHHDHWFGLAGMEDVTGISHENLLAEPSRATRAFAESIGLTELPLPSDTFSIARAINLGGGALVEMVHFGGAHTRGDVLVLVPGANVIFTGDMLESAGDPQFDETSNIKNWPTALDGVLGAANERTQFVPGHGHVVDRNFAFIQRAEIGMLYGNTEMMIQQGTALEDAADASEWPFTKETLEVALPLIYGELEAIGIKPRRQLPISSL